MPSTISGDANVSATEFGYLDGVTSALQTQIDGKVTTPGAWTAYTPVLTATTTNPTLGTGSSSTGAYLQIGKFVICRFKIVFGTSGVNAGSGSYRVSVPVAAAAGNGSQNLVSIFLYDSSTQNALTSAAFNFVSSTTVDLNYSSTYLGVLNTVASGAPWAWAASDQITGAIAYEAA